MTEYAQKQAETPEKNGLSPLAAAAVVCNRRRWTVSNLELQKILYIAEVLFFKRNGSSDKRLIAEDFHAWPLGPVLPPLYEKVKEFGSKRILPYDDENIPWRDALDEGKNSPSESAHLEAVADALKERNEGAYKLIRVTHKSDSAWIEARLGDGWWPKTGKIQLADMLSRDANQEFYNSLLEHIERKSNSR